MSGVKPAVRMISFVSRLSSAVFRRSRIKVIRTIHVHLDSYGEKRRRAITGVSHLKKGPSRQPKIRRFGTGIEFTDSTESLPRLEAFGKTARTGAVELVRGASKRTFGEMLKPGRCHVR